MSKLKSRPSGSKSIYLRTLAGFLAFYLLVMLAITIVMQQNIRYNNLTRVSQIVQQTAETVYADNVWGVGEQTMDDVLFEARRSMNAAPFPSKLFVCDDQYKVLAKSGNILMTSYRESSGSRMVGMRLEGLSDAALLEISRLTEATRIYPPPLTVTTRYVLQAWGHWEGHRFVASTLEIIEEKWQATENGRSLVERQTKPWAQYILSQRQAEDELIPYCQLMPEAYRPAGAKALRYNSQVQQAFRECADLLPWAISKISSENGTLLSGVIGEGFWTYDIFAVKACDQEVEGQKLGHIIATARTYPIWQAMRALGPLYLAGLLAALLLAGWMGWQLNKLKRRQEQLEDSRQALLVAVAHELKNPLSVIRSYSEGLLEDICQEKRADYLQVIIDETQQLDQMVVELLSLTRLTSADETLSKQPLMLTQLVKTACARCQRQLDERQLQLRCDINQQAVITADERLMLQALGNLLTNAINHTPQGADITITADSAQLTIANSGPTIDAQHWPHLFEPFYKVNSDRSRQQNGTGLGLAIVAAIAQLHGFSLSGRNLEDGVAFTLHFTPSESDEQTGT